MRAGNRIRKLNDFWIYALAVLVILAPHLIRKISGKALLATQAPYMYHKSLAPLNFNYNSFIYSYILKVFSYLFGFEAASILLPFIFGLGSVYLILKISRLLRIEDSKAKLFLLIMLASPIFIFSFSISNHYSMLIFFMALGFYLMLNNRIYYGVAILLILSLLSPIIALNSFFYLVLIKRNTKTQIPGFFWPIFLFLLIIQFFSKQYSYLINVYGFSAERYIFDAGLINISSDFGSLLGFPIFLFLLAFIRAVYLWKHKKKYFAMHLLFIISVLISIFITPLINIPANILLSFLAADALFMINKMKWKLDKIKKFTLFLVFLGFLFSFIAYVKFLDVSQPDNDLKEALEFLKGRDEGNVLSSRSNVYFIEYFADKKASPNILIDKNIEDFDAIYYSRNLEKTKELLSKHKIKYVVITEEMKDGEIWGNDDEGLLFLLQNSEMFKNIYKRNNIEIYEVMEI